MKYVVVELNHSGKQYEYETMLNLEVGKTYRIQVADGWTPPMRVRVVSVSNKQTYAGEHGFISAVTPAEEF